MNGEGETSILEKTQKLIELERLLTISLEKVEPWLTSNTTSSDFASRTTGTRVRPIPTNMDQVHAILSVARNLSTRTSAPAGWNPAAPVMGFSTPNPLPHQLRGGALGALELERARKAQEDKKRKLETEESERKAAKQKQEQEEAESKMEVEEEAKSEIRPDPKAADAAVHRANPAATARAPPRAAPQAAPAVAATTMNLSDSSSSDDDDDSDSD